MSTTLSAGRPASSGSSVTSTNVRTSSAANSATSSRTSTSSPASSSAQSGSSQSQGSSAQSSAAASSAPSPSQSAIPSSSSNIASSSTSSSSMASSSMSSSTVTSKAMSATAAATGGSVISSSNTDGSNTVSNKGLSAGAIGGIVGGVVGVLALCVLTWLLLRWKRRRRDLERYPLPAPRPDMVFAGKSVADKEERPVIAKGRGHESFNSLYAPSLPSYYPNYNRHVGSIHQGMDTWSPPQPQYMSSTTPSSPSTPSRSLQPMSSQSSMALTNAVAATGQAPQADSQDRPIPAPIQTTGLAPPASVDNGASNVSRRSSRSTMMFPHVSHSPSMTSMHSNGLGNTPHGGRRITLTMPTPLDPSTAVDGYLPHSRTNSISEFGQYTTSMYGSPASTTRRTRDSRRSLQPYHQGHLSPHVASASSELASIPGAAAPISGVSLHQAQSSISTITAPSSGPSRNGSGSAGSTSGGATSDSEALMIKTAKGKQVDRTSQV